MTYTHAKLRASGPHTLFRLGGCTRCGGQVLEPGSLSTFATEAEVRRLFPDLRDWDGPLPSEVSVGDDGRYDCDSCAGRDLSWVDTVLGRRVA